MKQNIILELDSFNLERVFQWLDETKFYQTYNIYVLVEDKKLIKFKERLLKFSNVFCLCYSDILNYPSKNSKLDLEKYYEFVRSYNNDHVTARLIDRSGYFPSYGIGNHNAFCYYTFQAYNVMSFLSLKKIDFILFRNTPHTIKEWLLARAALFLNIDIYTLEDYIFSWLYTVKKGFLKDAKPVFEELNNNDEKELKAHINKNVDIISGPYEKAIPTYEKKRLGKGYFKHFHPLKNFTGSLKKPQHLITRSINYYFYKKKSKFFDLKSIKYVVFFLHYQPERSTLPEGYEFVDQIFTINLLSKMLPQGTKLLVKEHPTMFSTLTEPKFRSLENYRLITKLQNVSLVSMDLDSFRLIDNAIAVASIKGTVTVEAYIRKKPVITFGKTNLNLPGVHNFNSIKDLKSFIEMAVNGKIKIENVVEELTRSCLNSTISGLTTTAENVSDYSFDRNIRDNASFKLLAKVLEYNLSSNV